LIEIINFINLNSNIIIFNSNAEHMKFYFNFKIKLS
jgi:hypothetical protein